MKCPILPRSAAALFAVVTLSVLGLLDRVDAASQQPNRPLAKSPREAAPIDLTGYWVSVVTEDWRWRMVTPPKGDYSSIPINEEGRKVADSWDFAKDETSDNQCRAYGAAAIMRMPGRVRISWENDSTLRIDTDAGTQTRFFQFGEPQKPAGASGISTRDSNATPSVAAPTWQGQSVASWEGIPPAGRAGGAAQGGPQPQDAPRGGSLNVVTTRMRPGYLRKNGVPYSENAVVTEYFDRHADYGTEWFTVTTIVEDAKFLTQPFITSSHFKREPDGSKWNPTPCEIGPPVK